MIPGNLIREPRAFRNVEDILVYRFDTVCMNNSTQTAFFAEGFPAADIPLECVGVCIWSMIEDKLSCGLPDRHI